MLRGETIITRYDNGPSVSGKAFDSERLILLRRRGVSTRQEGRLYLPEEGVG